MALTSKQLKFCDAVERGESNKDAAISAGCSAATASAAGSRLAKHPKVVAELERRGYTAAAAEKPASRPAARPQLTEPVDENLKFADPLDYLMHVMNSSNEDPKLRADAAKAMLPYKHSKIGEAGKKETQADAADRASKGKFGPGAAPKLVVNNR